MSRKCPGLRKRSSRDNSEMTIERAVQCDKMTEYQEGHIHFGDSRPGSCIAPWVRYSHRRLRIRAYASLSLSLISPSLHPSLASDSFYDAATSSPRGGDGEGSDIEKCKGIGTAQGRKWRVRSVTMLDNSDLWITIAIAKW